LRQSGDLIYLATGAAEFTEKLDSAVSEGSPEKRSRRMKFARENSWKSRVKDLDGAISRKFPKVSLLIVTYNSEECIGPCLRSVARNTSYPNYEVIVVDNASTDRSVAISRELAETDPRIHVSLLPKNAGFAGGNNAAAAIATGSYLVLLNADTVVTPGWIAFLMRHLVENADIGLICPVTNFAGNEAKINVDYWLESDMEEFSIRLARQKRGATSDVASVPLYCALIRRDLFQQLGGLDAGYEIGMFEDDDLSNAVRAAGLRTCVADDCFVHHFGQGSFSRLSREEYDRIFSLNRRRFEEKWERAWVPHRTRALVRPIDEERRYDPKTFGGAPQ
jgi:GT2 family glycosyltransferase